MTCEDCASGPGKIIRTNHDGTCAKCGEALRAIKHDGGKLRYDLIPPDTLKELVRVYTYGASKYSDRNWESGMSYGRIFAAVQRHLWAFWSREEIDKESHIHHLAHAAWGCLTLLAYTIRGVGNDDRTKDNLG